MVSQNPRVPSLYQENYHSQYRQFFNRLSGWILGCGWGSLFVPLLIALGYPTKQAVATCSLIVVFSSFAGFSSHVAEGHFEPKLLLFTTFAVIAGSQTGARLMRYKMKAKWIKRLFGLVLLLVALKLGLKVLLK